MSSYVFRGHSYEKLAISANSLASQQLFYRQRPSVDLQNHIIRSKETAKLLELDISPFDERRLRTITLRMRITSSARIMSYRAYAPSQPSRSS